MHTKKAERLTFVQPLMLCLPSLPFPIIWLALIMTASTLLMRRPMFLHRDSLPVIQAIWSLRMVLRSFLVLPLLTSWPSWNTPLSCMLSTSCSTSPPLSSPRKLSTTQMPYAFMSFIKVLLMSSIMPCCSRMFRCRVSTSVTFTGPSRYGISCSSDSGVNSLSRLSKKSGLRTSATAFKISNSELPSKGSGLSLVGWSRLRLPMLGSSDTTGLTTETKHSVCYVNNNHKSLHFSNVFLLLNSFLAKYFKPNIALPDTINNFYFCILRCVYNGTFQIKMATKGT